MKSKAFLVLIVVLAILIRLVALTNQGFYYDEAAYSAHTKLFLEGNSVWQTFGHLPPLYIWMTGLFSLLLGVNALSMRLVSAVFGTLTVVLVFFLAKRWYTEKEAFIASMLIAVMPLHVAFSRFAFIDTMVAFFTLMSIYLVESRKYLLSGLVFGLAFLAKYNAVVVWVLYWAYLFLRGVFLKDKKELKPYYSNHLRSFILINITAFVIILMFTGLKLINLFYLAYGVVYSAVSQTVSGYDTLLLVPLSLFDSLSPVLYIVFVLSLIYLILYDNKNEKTTMALFITILFLVIATFQTRTSLRHLVIITPFIAIIAARFLAISIPKLNAIYSFIVLALVMSSATAWTFYEIYQDIDYTVWTEAGKFIDDYPSDVAVHSISQNFPIALRLANLSDISYYTNKRVYSRPDPTKFQENDLVVLADFSSEDFLLYQEPIKNHLIFYKVPVIEPSPLLQAFIRKNATPIKTFYHRDRPLLFIYKLGYIDDKTKAELAKEKWNIFSTEKKDRFFSLSCRQIKKPFFKNLLLRFPNTIVKQIDKKCENV